MWRHQPKTTQDRQAAAQRSSRASTAAAYRLQHQRPHPDQHPELPQNWTMQHHHTAAALSSRRNTYAAATAQGHAAPSKGTHLSLWLPSKLEYLRPSQASSVHTRLTLCPSCSRSTMLGLRAGALCWPAGDVCCGPFAQIQSCPEV